MSLRYVLLAACALTAPSLARAQSHPIDRANLDTACAACQDFYSFANGGWAKRTTIPAAYSGYGSFNEVSDRNEALIRTVLDESAAAVRNGTGKAGSNQWKLGTFYLACTDSTTIESLGSTPCAPRSTRSTT